MNEKLFLIKWWFLSKILVFFSIFMCLTIYHTYYQKVIAADSFDQRILSKEAAVEPRFDKVPSNQYLYSSPPPLTPQRLELIQHAEESTLNKPALPLLPMNGEIGNPSTPPTETPIKTDEISVSQRIASPVTATDFSFFVNKNVANNSNNPPSSSSSVNEPSVAGNGPIIFYTGNWYAALSNNGGQTFSYLDPFKGPFSPVAGGFCCDQVTVYDPSRNSLFWLQQYRMDANGNNVQRINVDMGANGSFDCAYDRTAQNYNFAGGNWLDFPDLVLGSNNFLYHRSNVYNINDQFTGAVIIRTPLDEIANCQTTHFRYLTATDHNSFRVAQGSGATAYWGSHNSNSSIRIYSWPESSFTINWFDRAIPAWVWENRDGACLLADGTNPCARADSRILGAYVASGVVGFMWNAKQGGSFPYPYVRIARFRQSDLGLIDTPQIWNSTNAWHYPSVGVNNRGHIAGTIFAMGQTSIGCHPWIMDDISGSNFPPSVPAYGVGSSIGTDNMGDYLSSRPQGSHSNTWVASCYSVHNSGVRPQIMWFGRERDNPTHTLIVTKTGTGNGGVSGGGSYVASTTVTLTASPTGDSTFAGWSPSPCAPTFTMPAQNLTCTATFNLSQSTQPDLAVTSVTSPNAGVAGGQISVAATIKNQGSQAAGAFWAIFYLSSDSTITLGDISTGYGCNTSSLEANASSNCSGSIEIPTSVASGNYYLGVYADPDNTVSESNETNNGRAATNQISITGGGSSSYLLSVSKTGTGSGTVTSNPAGINCGADCSENYPANTAVTLAATPAGGSTFGGWSGACAGTGACQVTMNAAKSVTATFNPVSQTPAQDTVGLYNPTSGTFYLRNSNSAGVANVSFRYGPANAGWVPLTGDWDDNGTDTIGLYNPATGTFYLRNSNSAGVANVVFRYGPTGRGWIPLVGDWDGNGTDTAGLFDPATSTFYLRNSNSAGAASVVFRFGPSGRNWLPLVGDWDGNGTATVGLFDPATSTFYLRNSHSAGVADLAFRFGPAGKGWTPLTGDWDGNGTATVGLFDPATSTFYLRNSHSAGAANLSFRYGPTNAGWTPLAGDWNGPGL